MILFSFCFSLHILEKGRGFWDHFYFYPLFFFIFIKMYVFALRQSLMVAFATVIAKPEALSSMMHVYHAVSKSGAMVLAT